MKPPKEFRDEHIPVGYLITFRSYGTWLHGRRGSIDRYHSTYGTPTLISDEPRWRYNRQALAQAPVRLRATHRAVVEQAIRETCEIRRWCLWTVNVRSNHVHVVVTANCRPDRVLNAFKANCTRQMREARYCDSERRPWAEGGSKRYLWADEQLDNAIAYVDDDQGEPLD